MINSKKLSVSDVKLRELMRAHGISVNHSYKQAEDIDSDICREIFSFVDIVDSGDLDKLSGVKEELLSCLSYVDDYILLVGEELMTLSDYLKNRDKIYKSPKCISQFRSKNKKQSELDVRLAIALNDRKASNNYYDREAYLAELEIIAAEDFGRVARVVVEGIVGRDPIILSITRTDEIGWYDVDVLPQYFQEPNKDYLSGRYKDDLYKACYMFLVPTRMKRLMYVLAKTAKEHNFDMGKFEDSQYYNDIKEASVLLEKAIRLQMEANGGIQL